MLKGVFLLLLLAVVGWVIFTTTRGGLAPKETQGGQGRTLLEQFVISGGPIVWFILVPMSLAMVYLATEYCLTIRRKALLPADTGAEITRIVQEAELKRLAVEIGQRDDILGTAVAKALSKGVDDWFRMRETMFESVQDQAVALMRRIEWINLIGNVSPMVGLFGTVVGMIQLFNAMVAAGGQPQPVQLAAGISVALVTTFWGLLIAIPALAVYGIFRNRIETLANEAITQGEEILAQVRRVLRKRLEGVSSTASSVKPTIREIPAKSSRSVGTPIIKTDDANKSF
jgi:biopolymer transport protein ExbB